jgi:Zn-dependent protease with chaperone function
VVITGGWYASGGAAQVAATLHIDGELLEVKVQNDTVLSCHIRDVDLSDRLGNVERKLAFTNIGIFTTSDNNGVDQAFRECRRANAFFYFLETHMPAVIIALVFTIALAISFFRWGIPWVSETVAHLLPHKTNELIADQTLSFLDDYWFEDSELTTERQEAIRQHFTATLIPLDERNKGINYQLHFRAWKKDDKDIPNAFALPSGDIIVTDQFIRLATHQDEMDSVLLHEIGHVIERHSLEMIVQGTLVTTIVMLVSGDGSGIADAGLGLGAVLLSSHYSREHESEADTYAFERMLVAGIDPIAFSTIMEKMDQYIIDTFYADAQDPVKQPAEHKEGEQDLLSQQAESEENAVNNPDELLNYLSTHPSTDERQQNAQRYSECFKRGLTRCDLEVKN